MQRAAAVRRDCVCCGRWAIEHLSICERCLEDMSYDARFAAMLLSGMAPEERRWVERVLHRMEQFTRAG